MQQDGSTIVHTGGEGEHEKKHEHFEIFIDEQAFRVTQLSMTGAELKALAHKDPAYQLYEEVPGGEDQLIQDNQSVPMRSGLHFFTVPPATFGA